MHMSRSLESLRFEVSTAPAKTWCKAVSRWKLHSTIRFMMFLVGVRITWRSTTSQTTAYATSQLERLREHEDHRQYATRDTVFCSYKRLKRRSHTAEKRISMHPHKPVPVVGPRCRRCQCPCGYGYVIIHTYIHTYIHTNRMQPASHRGSHTRPDCLLCSCLLCSSAVPGVWSFLRVTHK